MKNEIESDPLDHLKQVFFEIGFNRSAERDVNFFGALRDAGYEKLVNAFYEGRQGRAERMGMSYERMREVERKIGEPL